MKRIIYTAVALILCASVFGIADYLDAKKEGNLVNYSDEALATETLIPEKKKEITPEAEKEKVVATLEKEIIKTSKPGKKIVKSKRNNEVHSLNIPSPELTTKIKEPVIEKMDITELVLQSKVTDSIVQPDTKRKLSMEMFSRAPIKPKKISKK